VEAERAKETERHNGERNIIVAMGLGSLHLPIGPLQQDGEELPRPIWGEQKATTSTEQALRETYDDQKQLVSQTGACTP